MISPVFFGIDSINLIVQFEVLAESKAARTEYFENGRQILEWDRAQPSLICRGKSIVARSFVTAESTAFGVLPPRLDSARCLADGRDRFVTDLADSATIDAGKKW